MSSVLQALFAGIMHLCYCVTVQVSLALKALYDDEIVAEELIIAWYGKPSAGKVLGVPAPAAKAVRQAAAKFVEWLQEAESDEDSDESEDSLADEE